MREAARSASAGGRTTRLRSVLVVGEFALALVLLVGAALLVQSFWRLQHVSLGFNPVVGADGAALAAAAEHSRDRPVLHARRARRVLHARARSDRGAARRRRRSAASPACRSPARRAASSFTIEGRPATAGDVAEQRGLVRDARLLPRARRRSGARPSLRRPRRCPRAAGRWSSARASRGSSFQARTRSASASRPACEGATAAARCRRRRPTG